jgi:transcription elongation factor Elf1
MTDLKLLELSVNAMLGMEANMNTKNACPFCGCHSTQVLSPTTIPNTSTNAKGYQIECLNCGARGPCGMAMPADAAHSWDNGYLAYCRPMLPPNAKVSGGGAFPPSA